MRTETSGLIRRASFVPSVEQLSLPLLGVLLAAEALAGSVAAAAWQPGLSRLPALVLGALIIFTLGSMFTRFGLARAPVHLGALLLGYVFAARMVGETLIAGSWKSQLTIVTERLVTWIQKASTGSLYQDDLLIALAVAVFLFFWTYLAFWVGLHAHLGWLAATLLGAAILFNVQYKPATAKPYLALWAAGSLVMVLGLNHLRRRRLYQQLNSGRWRGAHWLSISGGLVIAGIAVVSFAAAPAVTINRTLNDLWNKINGPIGQAERFYNSIGVPPQYDASQIRMASFQSRLKFVGPFRPGDALALKVKSERPRYEQGLVFDRYEHDGWTNTRFDEFESTSSEFSTLTAVRDTAGDRERAQISEQITVVRPKGALLFAPPQPLGASIRLKGDGFGDLRATQVIQPGQQYTAASLESLATAESLASATDLIPPNVRAAFLQLPSDMPARIKQLAEQTTYRQKTPFDKAVSLEGYLRGLPYDTDIPPPPSSRDGVDWFLFDLKRGYSDYYASAMAVMLRTLNIPSRLASGYLPGQFDPADGTYHVTEQQAHAWTQAYFPAYGWIDFEPTPGNPPFPRPRDNKTPGAGAQSQSIPATPAAAKPTAASGSESPQQGKSGAAPGSPARPSSHFNWWLLLLLAGCSAGALFLWSRLRGAPSATLAYARLVALGTILGLPPQRWQTPQEFGRELQARRRLDSTAAETITGLYSADRYGRQPLDATEDRRAWLAWQRIKARLLRPWLK